MWTSPIFSSTSSQRSPQLAYNYSLGSPVYCPLSRCLLSTLRTHDLLELSDGVVSVLLIKIQFCADLCSYSLNPTRMYQSHVKSANFQPVQERHIENSSHGKGGLANGQTALKIPPILLRAGSLGCGNTHPGWHSKNNV